MGQDLERQSVEGHILSETDHSDKVPNRVITRILMGSDIEQRIR